MDLKREKRDAGRVVLTSELVHSLINGVGIKVNSSVTGISEKALELSRKRCDEYTLEISNCNISEIDSFGKRASKVRTLDLSFNQLSRLNRIDELKQLRELRLHNNCLGPELEGDYVFENCQNLEMLYLNGNNLVEFPYGLHVLRKLRELRMSTNMMTSLTPGISKLASCRQLETLDLGGNDLSSLRGLEVLGGSLKHLILRENNLKALSKCIGELPLLEELDLGSNKLVSLKELGKLGNKMNLSILRVDRNRLSEWDNLPRLDSLNEFYAAGNRFTQVSPILKKYRHVDVVDVTDNRLSDVDDLLNLATIENLFVLSVSGNPLTQVVGMGDKVCTAIRSLSLFNGTSVNRSGLENGFKLDMYGITKPGGAKKASKTRGKGSGKTVKRSGSDSVEEVNKENETVVVQRSDKNRRSKQRKQLGSAKSRRGSARRRDGNSGEEGTDSGQTSSGMADEAGDGVVPSSVFSDQSLRGEAGLGTSNVSRSNNSFSRSLAEKLFAGNDSDPSPESTGAQKVSTGYKMRQTSTQARVNFDLKPLDDVDEMLKQCREKMTAVQRSHSAMLSDGCASKSPPDSVFKTSTEAVSLPPHKSSEGLQQALAYARADIVHLTGDAPIPNDGHGDVGQKKVPGIDKEAARTAASYEGKYDDSSDVSLANSRGPNARSPVQPRTREHPRSKQSGGVKRRGFQRFKIPQRAKDYVRMHLEESEFQQKKK